MRHIAPVILLFFPVITFSQPVKTDIEKMKLTGSIKTIYENVFEIIEDSGLLKKGPLASIVQYNFNEEGFLVEQITSDGDWELLFKIVYQYDENKRLASKEVYSKDGYLFYRNVFKYNSKNNSVRELEYQANGDLLNLNLHQYDNKGNLVRSELISQAGPTNKYEINYKYDDNNNVVELTTNRREIIFKRETWEYDKQGVLLLKNYFQDEVLALIVDFKYELDRFLNWIKLYEVPSLENWNQSFFRERNIAYY